MASPAGPEPTITTSGRCVLFKLTNIRPPFCERIVDFALITVEMAELARTMHVRYRDRIGASGRRCRVRSQSGWTMVESRNPNSSRLLDKAQSDCQGSDTELRAHIGPLSLGRPCLPRNQVAIPIRHPRIKCAIYIGKAICARIDGCTRYARRQSRRSRRVMLRFP